MSKIRRKKALIIVNLMPVRPALPTYRIHGRLAGSVQDCGLSRITVTEFPGKMWWKAGVLTLKL